MILDDSYHNLKEYPGYYLETSAMGLTADEMGEEMQRVGACPALTEKVVEVLRACETTRYTRNGASERVEAARVVAEQMREILNSKGVGRE